MSATLVLPDCTIIATPKTLQLNAVSNLRFDAEVIPHEEQVSTKVPLTLHLRDMEFTAIFKKDDETREMEAHLLRGDWYSAAWVEVRAL